MPTEPILIDTGPLVAYFNKRGQHNAKCAVVLDEIAPPLYTCGPVLTVASYLLTTQGGPQLVEKLLDSCGTGFLEILPLSAYDTHAIADFLNLMSIVRYSQGCALGCRILAFQAVSTRLRCRLNFTHRTTPASRSTLPQASPSTG